MSHTRSSTNKKTCVAKILLGFSDVTEEAIRAQDQAGAAAAVALYGESGHASKPVFDLLLKYAVSQDGALHAEKYYQTVTEEFNSARAKFRWNHLTGLARVTASEFGWPAP